MDNTIIDLKIWQVGTAYLFVLFALWVVRRLGIKRENEILISVIRMTVQLVLAGYVLTYVFENSHPIYTLLLLILMISFAIFTIYKRVKGKLLPQMKKVVAISMGIGTISSILFFNIVVIGFSPWYEPRYFIPIAGMMIGNSMTGIALGVNSLVDGMYKQRNVIETALMLGATPERATKDIVKNAFDAAILPTINSMIGMGIIILPGMMTGQILSGVSPLIAIEYQIAIMLGCVGSVSISLFIFVKLGYKSFFNKRSQLIY
jgi:putative ABC transport system permease protein